MDITDRGEVREFIKSIKARLPIDPYQLDVEVAKQPLLFEEVSSAASSARGESKREKELAEITRAEVTLKVRRDPSALIPEGVKVTESTIVDTVIMEKEYTLAKEKWLDAEEIASALDALQKTVEQRKSMLRDLVTLFTFRYYEAKEREPIKSKALNEDKEEKISDIRRRRRRAKDQTENDD